jgi:NhaC family Na+:H+ antiporter
MGLGRNMLSRTMEDGGTLWSPLVPWSSCGAYHSNILGVSTLAYLPFCFMNLINPVFALVTSAMKVNIFWADGSRTGFTGKLRKGDPAGAPDDAHAKAMEALARIREENGEDTKE